MEAPRLVPLDQSYLMGYGLKLKIQGLLILIHTIMMKRYKLQMSWTVRVRVLRDQSVIWNIRILWWMIKIFPIYMRKKTIVTSLERVWNGNIGRECDIMNKYRYHQGLVIIMAYMDSNLAW